VISVSRWIATFKYTFNLRVYSYEGLGNLLNIMLCFTAAMLTCNWCISLSAYYSDILVCNLTRVKIAVM
jgi:hypothetical protein